MRIRKHAKISPLLFTSASENPSAAAAVAVTQTHHHVCLLNQSPWDVMTFPPQDPPLPPPPPPPFLVDKECFPSYMVDSTFINHIAADESPKMEEKRDDVVAVVNAVEEAKSKIVDKKEDDSEIILCRKTDKKGWQCGERVKMGYSFCHRHLPKAKKTPRRTTTNSAAPPPAAPPKKSKRKPPPSSSNPYEFYYYSGFGPRWGKRRGSTTTTTAATDVPPAIAAIAAAPVNKQEPYSSSESNNGSGSGSDEPSTSRSITQENGGPNANINGATANNQHDNYIKNVNKTSQNHGIADYVEDDDDDEEEDQYEYDEDEYEEEEEEEEDEEDSFFFKGEIGKKRGRKPIKARSLKSLM